jgi:hypothetical protein
VKVKETKKDNSRDLDIPSHSTELGLNDYSSPQSLGTTSLDLAPYFEVETH